MDIQYGRKRKGIKQELDDKISDWLTSIDDGTVRALAKKNVIVTGGAIASMLLGEKVNDFDLYFRDLETTEAVARYYVDNFGGAEVRVENIFNAKDVEERRVLIHVPSAGVAGNDDEERDYRVSFMSRNAITLTNKIQLVTRFYGEPEEIHDNYDFQHACCYYDYAARDLVLPSEALECLLSRSLVYRGSLYPVASIFRMKKFLERGWRITAGQQLKIMWQISELDLTNKGVLVEQLTGVDMAYMYALIAALESVAPENIDAAYVAEVIDRIFE